MDTDNNYEEETTSSASDENNLQTNDPIQEELARVKPVRTEAEKATYTFKKQAEQLKSLGIDPTSLIEPKQSDYDDEDDDKPLTRGEWKKLQQQESRKTSVELAKEIPNESERELAIHYLNNRIVPSGDPQEDLRLALAAINSVKNGQVASMAQNRPTPNQYSSGSGMPAKPATAPVTDLTDMERSLKQQGLVNDEDIRKAREEARNSKPQVF